MEWASQDGNQIAARLLMSGESATVEFKECIPDQADKITKEIAAFATSGGGAILLGVNNQGVVVGLGDHSFECREKIADRITGIVNAMNPVPEGIEHFECYVNSHFVYLIQIPRQEEPAFYYRDTIYLRDQKCSRPAKPEEVKKLFLPWCKKQLIHDGELRKQQLEYQYEELQLKTMKDDQHASHLLALKMAEL